MKNNKQIQRLADIVVKESLQIKEGDKLLLNFSVGGIELAKIIGYEAAKLGAAVISRCVEKEVEAAILDGVGKNQKAEILTEMVMGENSDIAWANKIFYIRSNDNPQVWDRVNPKILGEYHKALYPSQKIRVERRRWSLLYLATTAVA